MKKTRPVYFIARKPVISFSTHQRVKRDKKKYHKKKERQNAKLAFNI